MSAPSPAQLRILDAADDGSEVEAPARTLAVLVRNGWVADGHITDAGRAVVAEQQLALDIDELAPRRARKQAAPVLVVVDDEDDQRTVYVPAALWAKVKAVHQSWTWRIVTRHGVTPGTAPAPPIDPDAPRTFGRKTPTRTTVDVMVPVVSTSLRCRHRHGYRAAAVWIWRSDKREWKADDCYAWHEQLLAQRAPDVVPSKTFGALVAADHPALVPAVAA